MREKICTFRWRCMIKYWTGQQLRQCVTVFLRYYELRGIPEVRNSGWRKFTVKKQGFRQPGITRNCNRNFNVITEVPILTELSEITQKLRKEPELLDNNLEITGYICDVRPYKQPPSSVIYTQKMVIFGSFLTTLSYGTLTEIT